MKRTASLLFLLLAAACQAATPPVPTETPQPQTATATYSATATKLPPPTHTPTEPAPIYVPAFCTLIGQEVRVTIPAGRPITLWWGWGALTEEQVGDFLDSGTTVVTFDGAEVKGEMQDGISYDEANKQHEVLWMAKLGIVDQGLHRITYFQTFSRKIFDGWEYYGPGTNNETQEDYCEVLAE